METGNVIIGVVAGAAVGVVLGILFAPAKGVVTRRTIRRETERQVEDLKEKFNDFIDDLAEKFDTVKEDVVDFAEKVVKNTEPSAAKS